MEKKKNSKKAEEVWKRLFPAKVGDIIKTTIQDRRGKHRKVKAEIEYEGKDFYDIRFLKEIKVKSFWGTSFNMRKKTIKKDPRRYKIIKRRGGK